MRDVLNRDRVVVTIHNSGPTSGVRAQVTDIKGVTSEPDVDRSDMPWYLIVAPPSAVDGRILADADLDVTVVIYDQQAVKELIGGRDGKPFVFPGPAHFTRQHEVGKREHRMYGNRGARSVEELKENLYDAHVRVTRLTSPEARVDKVVRFGYQQIPGLVE